MKNFPKKPRKNQELVVLTINGKEGMNSSLIKKVK